MNKNTKDNTISRNNNPVWMRFKSGKYYDDNSNLRS